MPRSPFVSSAQLMGGGPYRDCLTRGAYSGAYTKSGKLRKRGATGPYSRCDAWTKHYDGKLACARKAIHNGVPYCYEWGVPMEPRRPDVTTKRHRYDYEPYEGQLFQGRRRGRTTATAPPEVIQALVEMPDVQSAPRGQRRSKRVSSKMPLEDVLLLDPSVSAPSQSKRRRGGMYGGLYEGASQGLQGPWISGYRRKLPNYYPASTSPWMSAVALVRDQYRASGRKQVGADVMNDARHVYARWKSEGTIS